MRTYKIFHIAPTLTSGGVANVWINLTRGLTRLGHEVHLAGPYIHNLRSTVNSYIPVRPLPTIAKDPLYAHVYAALNAPLIKRVLKSEKIDLIITHGPLGIICLDRDVRIPCFSVVHGTYANEIKYMKHHPLNSIDKLKYILAIRAAYTHDIILYRHMANKGVILIAVSRKTKEELTDAGIREDAIHNVLNGVDREFFKVIDKEESKEYLKKKFDVELEGLVIAHVGLGPIKGTHMLVKALALLKRKTDVNFVAIFVGKLGPRSFKCYIEEMIRTYGLSKNIVILGQIPYEDLPYVYNAADITVVPSYSEGAPLVIPESLACGTPVIATDVGGNAEYLYEVGLGDLLIEIRKYDFADAVYEGLTKTIELYEFYKKLVDPDKIPSWTSVAESMLKLCNYNELKLTITGERIK